MMQSKIRKNKMFASFHSKLSLQYQKFGYVNEMLLTIIQLKTKSMFQGQI